EGISVPVFYTGTATLSGSVNNLGTASAPRTFVNRYEHRVASLSTIWTAIAPDKGLISPPTTDLAVNTGRGEPGDPPARVVETSSEFVPQVTPANPTLLDLLELRLCADTPLSLNDNTGAVPELDDTETSNCSGAPSAITRAVIIDRTTLRVRSVMNTTPVAGVLITQTAGTPAPNALGGTTVITASGEPAEYIRTETSAMTGVTLTAPLTIPNGTFREWTSRVASGQGCTGGNDTDRTCTFSIAAAATNIVTAVYNPVVSGALAVTLTPDKNDQVAPMQDVALTANVTGTATGAIGYDFNYGNGTEHVIKPNLSATTYTTVGGERRTYTTAGKYTARVDVTRGGLGAFDTEEIRVRPKLTLTSGPPCKSITAAWEPVNGIAANGYNLSRSDTLNGTYTSLTPSGTSATSYLDTSVAAGTVYFYKLQATLSDGSTVESDRLSQQSSAACPPGQQKTLTVSVTGPGTVRTDAGEINCGSGGSGLTLCSAIYPKNTLVQLTAVTASGAAFTPGWDGDCSGANPSLVCSLTMSSDRAASAGFSSTPSRPVVDSCFPNPNPATVGSAVTWTMLVSGGSGTYVNYAWTSASTPPLGQSPYASGQSLTINEGYGTVGTKNGVAVVTDSNGQQSDPTNCTALIVNPVSGFNYSLSAQSVSIGLNITKPTTATRTLIQGPTQAVTLQVASIKREADGLLVTGSSNSLTIPATGNSNNQLTITITNNVTANPTVVSNIDIRTRENTPLGVYTVTLRGVSSGIADKTATFTATVGATGGTTPLPVFEEF
ncbi:MAG TPA: hypothetical protein VJJ55_00575, partial [Candidatus Paceibacterota bacterium]